MTQPNAAAGHAWVNVVEECRCQLLLTGAACDEDNKIVCRKLKAATVGMDVWTWIENHNATENGGAAWMSLTGHCDGEGELSKHFEKVKHQLHALHHKSERTFPFKKMIARMKEAFDVLTKDEDKESSVRKTTGGSFA